MNIWIQTIVVFFISILTDIVWGLYIRRANEGKAISAANMTVGIMAFGAINVISYIQNHWLLIPIVLGNWLGTYSIVKWDHRTKK
jgi:hypothetical protein